MAVKNVGKFREAFLNQTKQVTHRIEKIEIGGEELSFRVRRLSFKEAGEYQKLSEGGKKDFIDLFFILISWGVFQDIDGSPLFEQEDKDTIKNSEVNDNITKLFLSFAKTEDGESIVKN